MKKSALILASVLALAGCTKKNNGCVEQVCEGWSLPKVVNEYLPYEEGQKLLFLNDNGDSLQFEVRNVDLMDYDSAHYTYTVNSCYPTGEIGPSGEVYLVSLPETNVDDFRKKGMRLELYGKGTKNGEIGSLWFCMLSDMYPRQCNISSEQYSGDVATLSDTICLNKENNFAVLVKGKGLVGYEDERGNGAWHLVEE